MTDFNEQESATEKNIEGSRFREEVYSKVVRAGKRTYFFDVKSTRSDEYYFTITESKKRTDNSGRVHYEKHKLFLYKEDFDKFSDALIDIIDFIKTKQPNTEEQESAEMQPSYADIEFEDLTK